jgi:hypothetical protein
MKSHHPFTYICLLVIAIFIVIHILNLKFAHTELIDSSRDKGMSTYRESVVKYCIDKNSYLDLKWLDSCYAADLKRKDE